MNNPIFQKLTHYDYRVSHQNIRKMLFFALGIGIFLAILENGNFQYIWSSIWDIAIVILGWLLVSLVPLVVIFVGTRLVVRDLHTSAFQLMLSTPIPSSHVVFGYFLTAASRLKYVLIWSSALLLPTIAGAILRNHLLAGIDCTGNSDFYQVCPNPRIPTLIDWFVWSAVSLSIILSLFGMNVLAAAIAIAASLKLKNLLFVIPVALLTYLLLALPVESFLWNLAIIRPLGSSEPPFVSDAGIILCTCMIAAFIPYLTGILLLQIAKTSVRKRA